MRSAEHPSLPREAEDGRSAAAEVLSRRAPVYTALVASAAVAGLGLTWLLASWLNPFAGTRMSSIVSTMLGPDAVAWTAVVTGAGGVVLAAMLARLRPGARRVAPLGVVAAVLAFVAGITFGSMAIIAYAGYLFGFAAVVAGIVTIVVTLVRAPRLGLPLLAGFGVLLAASVWPGGLTLGGVGEFATAFGGALAADLPNLVVIVVVVGATLAWTALAIIAIRATRGRRSFEAWLVRHRGALTILAALGPVPYAVARLSWLTPWPVFGPSHGALPPAMLATGLMLGAGAIAASILTLGLILPWGVEFPRWMPRIGGRPVPVSAATVPGLIAAGALCISAAPMFVTLVGGPDAPADALVVNLVLPFWFWGPMLALAVWAYAAWRGRDVSAGAVLADE
ncbi:hypothetical protein J7E25_03670 [Agromyces sp. ISL-38]|uniref:hypothetical protein n=1 Tax=Agromyces sp. ISL-38 TaxID=2819107 RepID=UPI001BEA4739|nr:hypothetical protein [Agromyces sp. ISL-38]MBT2498183.1 hypothetical protein [Agromyces sp. ISL-38]